MSVLKETRSGFRRPSLRGASRIATNFQPWRMYDAKIGSAPSGTL